MNTETVTAADLAADNLPAPAGQPAPAAAAPASAPAAAPASPAAAAPPPATAGAPAEVDAYGRPFDPEKFAPRKDRRGRWINKNAGRPPKSAAAATASGKSYVAPDPAPPGQPAAPAGGPAGPAAPQSDRFDLAAEIYSRAGYSVLDGLFSGNGEWLPENDGEHVAFRGALAAYLRHKGTEDLPPGAAFALAAATYAGKRITKPRTLSRLRFFAFWIRSKVYAWRTGRSLNDLPPPAPPSPAAAAQPLPPQNLPPSDSAAAVRV